MDAAGCCGFLVFRGWPGQPVGQSAWPSMQPTGLASQLRQSARSAAHSHEIRETNKNRNPKNPTHVQKLGSCSISTLMETKAFLDFWLSGVGLASQSASPPGHALSQLALRASSGSQQEAQPTSTKFVEPKKRKTKKNNTCTETAM